MKRRDSSTVESRPAARGAQATKVEFALHRGSGL